MTTTEYTSKVCSTCGIDKPLSDYYRWHSNNKYMAYCKKCHGKRTKRETPIPEDTCGVAHQNDLIRILRGMGMYASPGKSSEYAYADVVVWGCVRVEVKLGQQHTSNRWSFHFTEKQQNGGLIADLVALMCPIGNGYTCYLIEPSCPEFYREGKFKAAININLGTHRKNRQDGKRSLSLELLSSHQDNWQMIEEKRMMIAQRYQQKALSNSA